MLVKGPSHYLTNLANKDLYIVQTQNPNNQNWSYEKFQCLLNLIHCGGGRVIERDKPNGKKIVCQNNHHYSMDIYPREIKKEYYN